MFQYIHEHINIPLLHYLHSFVINEEIKFIVFLLADIPIFFLPFFLVGAWIYHRNNSEKKKHLLMIFTATVIAISINLIIQQYVILDRPESALIGKSNLILSHIPDASFPSDHASVSFAFITALRFVHYKKLAYILLPFMLSMNIARVMGGIHWPADIVVGIIIGIGSAIISYAIQWTKMVVFLQSKILRIAQFFWL